MDGRDLKSCANAESSRFAGAEDSAAWSAALPVKILCVHCEEVTKTGSVHPAPVVSDPNAMVLCIDTDDDFGALAGVDVLERVDYVLPNSRFNSSKQLSGLQYVAPYMACNRNRIA
jgi:hypothetical protein